MDIVFVLLCYFYSRSLIFAFIWSTSATHSVLLYTGGFSFFYYVSRGERRGGGVVLQMLLEIIPAHTGCCWR